MDDGFGIAAGAILMAARSQVTAQFVVVVNLAVVNDPDAAVFVADGLVPGFDVDDAEAAHRQADTLAHVEAIVVRAAVDNLAIHVFERRAINRLLRIETEDAADSTHMNGPCAPVRVP